jgi:hypothetical protein
MAMFPGQAVQVKEEISDPGQQRGRACMKSLKHEEGNEAGVNPHQQFIACLPLCTVWEIISVLDMTPSWLRADNPKDKKVSGDKGYDQTYHHFEGLSTRH